MDGSGMGWMGSLCGAILWASLCDANKERAFHWNFASSWNKSNFSFCFTKHESRYWNIFETIFLFWKIFSQTFCMKYSSIESCSFFFFFFKTHISRYSLQKIALVFTEMIARSQATHLLCGLKIQWRNRLVLNFAQFRNFIFL